MGGPSSGLRCPDAAARTWPGASGDAGTPLVGPEPASVLVAGLELSAGAGLVRAAEVLLGHFAHVPGATAHLGLGPSAFRGTGVAAPSGVGHLTLAEDPPVAAERITLLLCLGGDPPVLATQRALLGSLCSAAGLTVGFAWMGTYPGTGRDHTGFYDGTENLQELSAADFARSTFLPASAGELAGGSFLVLRLYLEDLDMWADLPDEFQEAMVGRRKMSGLFLDDQPAWSSGALSSTDIRAHIRAVRPTRGGPENWKDRIFRRSVPVSWPSSTPGRGVLHGLLFLALVRDVQEQFVRVHDAAIETGDMLLTSGYVKPLLSECVYMPIPGKEISLCRSFSSP